MAKLVLMPSKKQNVGQEEVESEDYLALHTLLPSNLFKDQYVSVRSTLEKSATGEPNDWSGMVVTATLKSESRSVQILLSRPAGSAGEDVYLEHTARVLGETTIYRSTTSTTDASNTGYSSKARKRTAMPPSRKERVRIRVLTIDRLVVPGDLLSHRASTTAEGLSKKTSRMTLEREKDDIEDPSTGAVAFPSTSPQKSIDSTSSNEKRLDSIPLRRQFLADLAFLMDPPKELNNLRSPLREALDTLVRASDEFTNAYVYVSGFDAYNVSRIRRGILSRAWQAFESYKDAFDNGNEAHHLESPATSLGQEGRARLLLLLENVVMGHCHGKIYSSIRMVYRDADEEVDNVVCTYQELQVSLDDLKVNLSAICRKPSALDKAIFIMKHLGDADEDMEHLLDGANANVLRSIAKQGDLSSDAESVSSRLDYLPERNRSRIRTPLDVLDVLHATLEEIGMAIAKAQKHVTEKRGSIRGSMGTDELLPILAYVIIRAGPMKLVSLLYYTRHFGLSDAISSQSK
jgi:hypothetical protein